MKFRPLSQPGSLNWIGGWTNKIKKELHAFITKHVEAHVLSFVVRYTGGRPSGWALPFWLSIKQVECQIQEMYGRAAQSVVCFVST